MKNKLKTIAALLAVLVMFPTDFTFAKGSSGGSRSSGSSSRFSGSSSPKPVSSPTISKYSGGTPKVQPGTATAQTKQAATTPKFTSQVEKQKYEAAVKQGTVFTSKTDAQAAFKKNYGSQYTSKYTTQPTTRPNHIPQSTTVDGKTVNINYNPQYGGYGYMNGLGTWVMYDALSDAVMMSALMSNHNYVTHTPVVAHAPVLTFFSIVFQVLVFGFVLVVVIAVIKGVFFD